MSQTAQPRVSPTPQRPTDRLAGLDLARYLAFVGMVIVNFKVAMGAEDGTGLLAQLTALLEGKAAATFVVLAGIGLGLAGQGALDRTLSVTLRRALFLMGLGLVNMLIFDADILHFYAVYFLFGVALLPCTNRTLWGALIGVNLLFVALVLGLNYDAGWDWTDYTYADLWTPLGFLRHLFFNGWHPVIPWISFLILGILLARLPLQQRRVQSGLMLGGAMALGVAAMLSAGLMRLAAAYAEAVQLLTTEPIPPMPLYMLSGYGAACLVVGLCLRAAAWAGRSGVMAVVVPAGRQTLTLYLAHILIGMGVLEALGLLVEQGQAQSVPLAVGAALLFCVLATGYAWAWNRHFKRGPVEMLMRRLAG